MWISRSGGVEPIWLAWQEWTAGWRNSFGKVFPRTGAWLVNYLSCYFESRGNCGAFESDSGTEERVQVSDWTRRRWADKKACEIEVFCRWLKAFCIECVDQFWANACKKLTTCEIWVNRGDCFRNSKSSTVENLLKTIKLRVRKVEKERVAIVYLGMNEICSNSF